MIGGVAEGGGGAGNQSATPSPIGAQQDGNRVRRQTSSQQIQPMWPATTAVAPEHEPLFGSPLEDVVTPGDLLDGAQDLDGKGYSTAVRRTLISVGSAGVFGIFTWVIKGKQSGLEFFAGYLVEQSLSVDNLFVFIMLFDYFAVPLQYQSRVLTWGIAGAVIMRGIMIALGVAVIKSFQWIIIIFAGILLVSSAKLLSEVEEHGDLADNFVVKISSKMVGAVDQYDGESFFTTTITGKKVATPLLLCLVCIELSDFVFAVDSIPAVLGVSQDPFVVYSSNIFAIMALRSIYTIIAKAVNQLPYLKPAVALVLGFVGIKMILEFFHYEISTGFSLAVVMLLIFGGVGLSLMGRCWKERRASEPD
ncbi:unnamed protein product [Chrysoparadoxa australica]